MYRECCVCHSSSDYNQKREIEGFSQKAHHFCRIKCFQFYICSSSFSPISTQRLLLLNTEPFLMSEQGSEFSTLLHRHFRSHFEVQLAELLSVWGIYFVYEGHGIPVEVDGTVVTYCPDFYLPNHGVWIEVKGRWVRDSRKRFEAAIDILGNDRLLLLPYFHSRELGRLKYA